MVKRNDRKGFIKNRLHLLLFCKEKEELGELILSTEKLYLFFVGSSQYLEIACTDLLMFLYFPPVVLQPISGSWPPLTGLRDHIH